MVKQLTNRFREREVYITGEQENLRMTKALSGEPGEKANSEGESIWCARVGGSLWRGDPVEEGLLGKYG